MGRRLPAYRPGVRLIRLSGWGLKWVGLALACLSSFSAAVLQRGVLKLDGEGAMEALQEAMRPGGDAMGWATGAVLCALAATLAIPIWAKVVYEGAKQAQRPSRYLGALALCALASEVPYDFAMSGRLWDPAVQNPVWGLLLAAIMLVIFRFRRGKTPTQNTAFQAVVTLAAVLWCLLLRVYMGSLLVLLCALFHFAGRRRTLAAVGGVLLTLFQFPAPLGLLPVRWYDRELEEGPGWLFALLYPVQLAAFGLWGLLVP